MNLFKQFEDKGRTQLIEILNQMNATDIKPTDDIYDPVDMYFTHKDKKVVTEIKCRDEKYENFPTHLIEKKKLKAIINDINTNKLDSGVYVNFFGEDVAYFYLVKDILKTGKDELMMCKKSTAVYTGHKEKETILIPTTAATIIKKINNEWKITQKPVIN